MSLLIAIPITIRIYPALAKGTFAERKFQKDSLFLGQGPNVLIYDCFLCSKPFFSLDI